LKLSVSLDLSTDRAVALEIVDAYYNTQVATADAVPRIHAVKLVKAQNAIAGQTPDPALVAEAAGKDVTVAALCLEIVQKAAATDAAILTLEAQRQATKIEVGAATTQQAIHTIIGSHR